MMVLQRDLEIYRMELDGKYEYQLFYLGKPIKSIISFHTYRYGAVNVSPVDESICIYSMYTNPDTIPDSEIDDPTTFIVPVKL